MSQGELEEEPQQRVRSSTFGARNSKSGLTRHRHVYGETKANREVMARV